MQVGGILETALYVSDVRRAAEFYRRLFGFPTLLESERLVALDVAGRSVSGVPFRLVAVLSKFVTNEVRMDGNVLPEASCACLIAIAFTMPPLGPITWPCQFK